MTGMARVCGTALPPLRTLFRVMPVSLAFAIAQARSERAFTFVVADM